MNLAVRISEAPQHRLAGALEGVAHELGLLRAHMLRMQDVCHMPDPGMPLDSLVIRELQGLDLMSQRLDALTSFVRAVIHNLPFDPAMQLDDALDAVPLGDLADRLGGRSTGGAVVYMDADAGDFDLF